MNTTPKQLNLSDIIAVAGFHKGNTLTHSQRILLHINENGIEGLMIFETVQEGSQYWLVGQKIEINKWVVRLVDPRGTFHTSMGECTDVEFDSTISEVDANVKAALTVEALDIVPTTVANIDFKYKQLSKRVEKKINKIWPF